MCDMSKMGEMVSATKLGEVLEKRDSAKIKKTILWVLAIVGAIVAIAAIAYAVYSFIASKKEEFDEFEEFEDFGYGFEEDFMAEDAE